jgi:hypothetical protein
MEDTDIKPGYVYHIKDLYFDMVKDDKLMKNHEGNSYRPTYFCVRDVASGLLWVIPMSSRVEKYQLIVEKDTKRHGKCVKIVIGEYGGRQNAFLIQNMFPILPKYIDHVHLIKNNPAPVHTRLQRKLNQYFREAVRLHKRGVKIVFVDITRIERQMLDELKNKN